MGLSGLNAVLAELEKVVVETLSSAFNPFFSQVDEALFDRADGARNLNEQHLFFNVLRILRNQRETVATGALDIYRKSFSALLGNDLSRALTRDDASELELLENHVLEEMIALDTIVSGIVAACGKELDFLTKRLEYLSGQPLRSEDNPFVPEPLCEAFAAQLRHLQLDTEPKLLILKCFEKFFLVLWPGLVGHCNQMLKERGVLPDLEKQKREVVKSADKYKSGKYKQGEVKTTDADDAETPDDSPRESPPRPAVRGRNLPKSYLVDEIHRYLSSLLKGGLSPWAQGEPGLGTEAVLQSIFVGIDAGTPAETTLDQLNREGLESAIASLLEARQENFNAMDSVDRSVVRILDQSFKKLKTRQSQPGELLSVILRLELPVACMVLRDPQFLDKQNHPGRRLVNEIFRVSSTFLDGADGESDPLRKEVDGLIARLSQFDLSHKELTRLLSEFIDFVEKDKRRLVLRERRLLEEEEAAAKVSLAHKFVHHEFSRVLLEKVVPRFLIRFCEDAWCKVVFLDLLRNGKDNGAWQARVADLNRLVALIEEEKIPGNGEIDLMLGEIHEQLDGISLDPGALARWMTLFSDYFSSLLHRGNPLPKNHAFEKLEVEQLVLRLPGIVIVDPPEDDDVDSAALESVDMLKQGMWVEFRATEESPAVRCKLAGVVNPVSKYVFTNRKGMKVAEENRSHLARKMKVGNVIVLQNSHLFDDAFKEVVGEIQAQAKPGRGIRKNDNR